MNEEDLEDEVSVWPGHVREWSAFTGGFRWYRRAGGRSETLSIVTKNLLIWRLMCSREKACSDLFDKSRSDLDSVLHCNNQSMREFKRLFNQKNMHQRRSTDRQVSGKRYRSKLPFRDLNILGFFLFFSQKSLEAEVLSPSQENNRVTTESCQVRKASHTT